MLGAAAAAITVAPAAAHARTVDDLRAALPTALEGAACKSAGCQTKSIDELRALLDVTGVPHAPTCRTPSSRFKKLNGLKPGTPSRIKLTLRPPAQADERVELLWLAEKASGRVLAARGFAADRSESDPKLTFIGIYSDDELEAARRVQLVSRALWSRSGLCESAPYTFDDIKSGGGGADAE